MVRVVDEKQSCCETNDLQGTNSTSLMRRYMAIVSDKMSKENEMR
jgi:hypothetical protein